MIPRRQPRDSCYFHGIGWHRVSVAAIRITRQAPSEGLSGKASADRASEIVLAEDLTHEEQWALTELLSDGTVIQVSRGDDGRRYYINRRHRTTAMLEADVRRTVMIGGTCQTARKAPADEARMALRRPSASPGGQWLGLVAKGYTTVTSKSAGVKGPNSPTASARASWLRR